MYNPSMIRSDSQVNDFHQNCGKFKLFGSLYRDTEPKDDKISDN